MDALSPDSRMALFYSIMNRRFGAAALESFSEDRYALEAMSLNPIFHTLGFHVDFKPGQNALRARNIVRVDDLIEMAGRPITVSEIVELMLARFPDAEVKDLAIEGLSHFCMVGDWLSIQIS